VEESRRRRRNGRFGFRQCVPASLVVLAIEAAEGFGNIELAEVLKRR
jgi:hypothetical protein